MPRKARIVIENTPHHISHRGNRKQDIFFDNEDRLLYLDLLKHYCKKNETYLICYCLMHNHVHLVLIPQDKDSLWKVLKPVNMIYTRKMNNKMNWCGHLWQDRFYSDPMTVDSFFTQIKYILDNPVKAGICSKATDYKWSCAKYYYNYNPDPYLYMPKKWNDHISNIRPWLSNDFSSLIPEPSQTPPI